MDMQKAERSVRVDFIKGNETTFSFFSDERILRKCSTFFKNMISGDATAKIYKAHLPHPNADLQQIVCYLKTGMIYCSANADPLKTFGASWVNAEYLGLEGFIDYLKGLFLQSMKCVAEGEGSKVNLFESPSFMECMTDQNIEELLKHLQKNKPHLIREVPLQVALGKFLKAKGQKFELTFAQRLFLEASSKPFLQISVEQNTSVLKPDNGRQNRRTPRQILVQIPPELRHFMIHHFREVEEAIQENQQLHFQQPNPLPNPTNPPSQQQTNQLQEWMQQAFEELLNEASDSAVQNEE